MSKIDAIAKLKDGWLGDGTRAPSPEILSWIEQHALLIASAPVPTSVIPDADGFVSLVWEARACEFTAEIHDDSALLVIDHLDTEEVEEYVIPREWTEIQAAMVSQA